MFLEVRDESLDKSRKIKHLQFRLREAFCL